jgi:hypothetical protein
VAHDDDFAVVVIEFDGFVLENVAYALRYFIGVAREVPGSPLAVGGGKGECEEGPGGGMEVLDYGGGVGGGGEAVAEAAEEEEGVWFGGTGGGVFEGCEGFGLCC